ncbi:MAG: NADH-ubiquinone oxidoreductase-F iron-sulfur binding region domain-containing protein [Candidatus Hatepunaea meridiana]|nr:NADH-ubiquinone oxidoreductase-F iron-sulfur binding region domain-containing protein [Candidatus Hatepunaea meridiana]
MRKLTSIDEFKGLQDRLIADQPSDISTIIIPAGTCGQASGANDIIRAVKREILAKDLSTNIRIRITGCHGFCEMEPSILIEPQGTFYPKVNPKDIPRIIDAILKDSVVDELLWKDLSIGTTIAKQQDIPFFKQQTRTIISRSEKVDPIRIYNYLRSGGYRGLAGALDRGEPKWVVNEVKISGLRGRGGAGFPTGLKWEFLAAKKGDRGKFLVCNADEGDPGAYMDRSVLEGNPHSIIEGMLIGAYATGATNGVVYARYEYPLAIKHLLIALRQARELGLLGENILGTSFSFDIDVIKGAGAFVCGEETALIRSIEGKMGEPRQRPPFPTDKGVEGKPTVINNVETWANIPVIFEIGAKEFAQIGTKGNSGTKIFSLVGKVKNTGLVEVPMGITIGEIVFDIGGGSIGKAAIKAVQTGGPSGGCIPVSMFDLPIDYDSLAKAGSIMGSGGMIVMDENTCIVDIAKYYVNFLKDESCGKCYTCRKGTQRMYELLEDITEGRGTLEHLDLLEELAHVVADTTMCGLGQTASNPVLSTLKYFRDEYIEHIIDKRCRASVCKDLVGAPCQATCPIGTEAWRYIAHISRGEYEEAYISIREENPFPSICARVCDHKCESRCRLGQSGDRPVAIRALKRFVTDNVDPSVYKPKRSSEKQTAKVAIVGAGPGGLTAAHYLSLKGYPVTVFEMDSKPGGMLFSCIPAYRLPQDVLTKEIEAVLDENITLECNRTLGTDFTVNSLFDDGYKAVFIAVGAQKGRQLDLEGEDAEGVLPSIEFLKAFNQEGIQLAKGNVGVIGGGNSAVDAARTALRQEGVEKVTILYRRTQEEMPAFEEEIEAAVQEGITLETLVAPVKISTEDGKITGVEFQRNQLGKMDSSGRRRPVPMEGSNFNLPLDTLIIAISEQPDVNSIKPDIEGGLEITRWNTLQVNENTLECGRSGVFAGGDVVTGPNTVIAAIADGKKAAVMIDRYIHGEELRQIEEPKIPKVYVEPYPIDEDEQGEIERVELPRVPVKRRSKSFIEVERAMSDADAEHEAIRCLRCDLEFTTPKSEEH